MGGPDLEVKGLHRHHRLIQAKAELLVSVLARPVDKGLVIRVSQVHSLPLSECRRPVSSHESGQFAAQGWPAARMRGLFRAGAACFARDFGRCPAAGD